MNIGDLYFALRANDARLEADVKAAGSKAGQTLAQAIAGDFKKSFTGANLGKGIVQGLGLAGGLGIANIAANTVSGLKDAFVGTVDAAANFERGMLNVQSITQGTEAELATMGQTVLDLSGEFGQSAETMTQALYDISSSGFQGADALEVLRAASKSATAGLATTSEAASGITAVLNAYGMSAEEASDVSDVLFQTVNRGVVSFPQLSAEIGKTTALAAPLGVSLEEVGAAIAVMTRAGIDAENATTQLNAIMSSMLKPSKEASDLAAKLGINWSAAGLKANGLVGTLNEMLVATDGNQEAMATLLGDARAIRGAFSLAARGGAEFTDELKVMNEAAGETDKAFGIQSQGAAFRLQQMKAELEAAGIEIGQKFLPVLIQLADVVIEDVVPAIKQFADLLTVMSGEVPVATDGVKDHGAELLALAFRYASAGSAIEEWERQLNEGREAEAAVATETARMAGVIDFMANATKDDLIAVADNIEGVGDAAQDASTAVRQSARDILASIAGLRAGAEGDAQAAAAALYDPIILGIEQAETAEELRAVKKKLRDQTITADERAELHKRRQELGKTLIEQTGLLLTYGTQAEQISKTKAFLASGFWAEAYEGATPEQAAALDAWRLTLQQRVDGMTEDARVSSGELVDKYTGTIEAGRQGVTTATGTMVGGMRGPLTRAEREAYKHGETAGQKYADGVASKVWATASAAAKHAAQMRTYLRQLSPAKKGPLSEGGGTEGWGADAISLFAEGGRSQISDIIAMSREAAKAVASGLTVSGPRWALAGAVSVPSAGGIVAPSMVGAQAGSVTRINNITVPITGLLKARDPFDVSRNLQRAADDGVFEGPQWHEDDYR